MKKVYVLAALILVLISSLAVSETPLGPVEMTSIDELAYAVAAYFPKVQGGVTAVQGDRLTIALGEKNGILPGMVMTVWRDGKEILHPVTKAVIGRAEDEVGTLEVVNVKESSSSAVMKKQVREPKTGDRVRITPKKISIAILPLRNDRPEIIQGLAERMGELGRFTVLGKDKVAAFLADRKQRDAALIKEMGSAFALDAVVAVAIYPSEGKYLVTGRIFTADDAKPIDTIVAQLNLTTRREALGDVRPFFAPVKDVSGKAEDLPIEARYFVLADIDGDGAAEYVFSDEKKLVVYRADKSGWKEVWTESVGKTERDLQQFHLDAADINGNGRAEIFVTRLGSTKVSSTVVEFENGSFRRTAEIPGFLRVVRYPGRGLVLIGQDFAAEPFFAGQPREYTWSGSAYVPGAPVVLPKDVDLYRFVFADLGEGRPMMVALDKDRHLVVYSGETAIWKSEEKYLTAETVLNRPKSGMDLAVGREASSVDQIMMTSAAYVDKSEQVKISGRLIAVDLYGSGKDDLVVAKNSSLSLAGGYKGGELQVLGWTGARLEPRWTVRDLAGPVLDIQASRTEKAGIQIHGLVQIPGGVFSKNKSRVEKYDGK